MDANVPDSSEHAPAQCPAMSSEDIRTGKRHPCLAETWHLPGGMMMRRAEKVLADDE